MSHDSSCAHSAYFSHKHIYSSNTARSFSVPQTHRDHFNPGNLALVVPTAQNSHDSSSPSDFYLNVTLVFYITMELWIPIQSMCYNQLLELFLLLLKLFRTRSLEAPSGWLLCSFAMCLSFFEHFIMSWHKKDI